MNFTVRSEHGHAVVFDVEFATEDYFSRAEVIRDTVFHGEIIKPHDDMVEEMDEHDLGEASIGEGTYDSSITLFDDPNPGLDVSNAF